MRGFSKSYRLLALAGLLSVVAWGCSTDSPTAPRQEIPPPTQGGGQAYFISVGADPGAIVVSDTAPTGSESTTIALDVRLNGPNGPRPADGTTILVTTTLGSFSNAALIREGGVELVNGRAFVTLFSGGLPVQLGVAFVQGFLGGSSGQAEVPISILEAAFTTSNPEGNLSVTFLNGSAGNPDSFLWDFGDGTSSTEVNPHHLYTDGGTYQVKLTVSKQISGSTLSDSTSQAVAVGAAPVP